MAVITPVPSSTAGAAIVYAPATSGGDTLAAGLTGGCILKIINAAGSGITVTLAGSIPCSDGFTHAVPYTVPANTTFELVVPRSCVNASTGNVAITYSAVTTVTVAASSFA